ncbi:MAG: 1-acyl-sn-glycerol-3-phosphate acyltransferase [Bacteroidales bacterium]|nr:1-acyl-sn-glycerol-3-phosphate acyltransferase [Bacteroidales bacterium]
MRTISGYILTTVLGWKIRGDFPDIKKGIVIYAPHTSYLDALYGKLYCNELNINHKFLSKKEFFYFPLDIGMKLFGSIPVRNVKNKNAIYQVIEMLNNSKELLVLISPEGTLAKVTRWNKGFYYMATKAHVPIIVGYIDYKKKGY